MKLHVDLLLEIQLTDIGNAVDHSYYDEAKWSYYLSSTKLTRRVKTIYVAPRVSPLEPLYTTRVDRCE